MPKKKSVFKKIFSKPDKKCCSVEFEEIDHNSDNQTEDKHNTFQKSKNTAK